MHSQAEVEDFPADIKGIGVVPWRSTSQQPQQWRQATQLSLYTFVISHRDVARYYRDAHPDGFGILRFDIGIRKSMGDVEKSIALSPERAVLSQ